MPVLDLLEVVGIHYHVKPPSERESFVTNVLKRCIQTAKFHYVRAKTHIVVFGQHLLGSTIHDYRLNMLHEFKISSRYSKHIL